MTLIKKFENKFTMTPNVILNDPTLSLKAKGLWTYLNSKPDAWSFSVNGIKSQSKDGKESVTSGLKELEERRYLKRVANQESDGRFNGYIYHIFDFPYAETTDDVKPVNGEHSNHSNKDLSNKEEVKPIKDLFADEPVQDISKEVLKYLNETKPGKTPFQFTSTNLDLIKTRIKEKFTIDDFKCVINYKVAEWKESDKMKKYIRPKTLFGTKFGDYVVESKDFKPGTDGSGNFEYKPQETPELI